MLAPFGIFYWISDDSSNSTYWLYLPGFWWLLTQHGFTYWVSDDSLKQHYRVYRLGSPSGFWYFSTKHLLGLPTGLPTDSSNSNPSVPLRFSGFMLSVQTVVWHSKEQAGHCPYCFVLGVHCFNQDWQKCARSCEVPGTLVYVETGFLCFVYGMRVYGTASYTHPCSSPNHNGFALTATNYYGLITDAAAVGIHRVLIWKTLKNRNTNIKNSIQSETELCDTAD